MKNLFKLTLLLLAMLLPATATAYDFEVNGIYYNITSSNTVEVTSIPGDCYNGNVTIPETVTYNDATYTVTAIGDNAFYVWDGELTGITGITIPNSVTTIGNCAFMYCSSLKSITIPHSVTSIGNNAFLYCESLTSIVVASGNPKFDSRNNCNALIETATNTLIVGCENTIIPNSVTSIGNCAFYYCWHLTSIDIPNSVTTIGNGAFYLSGLTSIDIPNSVISIGENAFSDCWALSSASIGNSVTSIGGSAFSGCQLDSVNITDIAAWCNICFEDICANPISCANHLYLNGIEITDLTIPNTATSISKYAFLGCRSLKSVTIPNSIISIGESAFSGCQLDSVNITDIAAWCNICFEDIYANPLSYANHLYLNGIEVTDLTIPNTITSISKYAFAGCRSLTSVNIGNSVTTIGESVFRSSGLTSVTIGNSVTTIGESAFCCSGLTSATIPNSVTYIGNDAFAGCTGLSIVTIPNSVTTIGDNAFSNCSILNEVYSYITDPLHITMGFNVFSPYNSNRTLYVPEGTFEVYSTYSRWSDYFGSIVEMEFEPTAIAESIQLNVTTAGLNEGATLQLTAMVQPEEGTSKKMNWASSNPSIATVDDNGLVTTHSVGTATITAMTTDGSNLSASCTVTLLPVGLKGDVNEDGRLNISDVSYLIDMLLDR